MASRRESEFSRTGSVRGRPTAGWQVQGERDCGQVPVQLQQMQRSGSRGGVRHSVGYQAHDFNSGWRGYFGFCETPEVLIALTRWVRLRLRSALWRFAKAEI